MKTLFSFFIFFVSVNVSAVVVGFDSVTDTRLGSSGQFISASYVEDGMIFTPLESSGTQVIRQGTSCSLASSGSAMAPCTNDNSSHMLMAVLTEHYSAEITDGSLFKLLSIELAEYSWSPCCLISPRTVTIIGNRFNGSEVSQTFITDAIITSDPSDEINDFELFSFSDEFTNLESIEIVTDGYALDNLEFVVVPIPPSILFYFSSLIFLSPALFKRLTRKGY